MKVVPINGSADDKQEIHVHVETETLAQSIASDLSTVAILGGPILINELTIQSSALSFFYGIMLFFFVVARALKEANKNIIRGKTVDDVCAKLRVKLQQENFN